MIIHMRWLIFVHWLQHTHTHTHTHTPGTLTLILYYTTFRTRLAIRTAITYTHSPTVLDANHTNFYYISWSIANKRDFSRIMIPATPPTLLVPSARSYRLHCSRRCTISAMSISRSTSASVSLCVQSVKCFMRGKCFRDDEV